LRGGDKGEVGKMSWVMTVEQDAPSAGLVRDALAFAGQHVLRVESVAEAVKRLRVVLPDVVLTGGLGGEQLLAHIRSHESLAFLPVVAVTASATVGERERLVDLGFDGYLSEPFTLTVFERQVAAFAAMGALRRAARVRGTREIAEPLGA
jgi:CheY-like chemotaxis protein